jgi:hypothetical protein
MLIWDESLWMKIIETSSSHNSLKNIPFFEYDMFLEIS